MAAAEHDQGCDCSHCKALRILTSETLSMEGKIRKMRELQASLKPPPEPEGEKGDDKGEASRPQPLDAEAMMRLLKLGDGYQRGWDDAFKRVKGDDKGDGYQRGWDDAFERVFQVLREKFTRRAVNTAPNHRNSAP